MRDENGVLVFERARDMTGIHVIDPAHSFVSIDGGGIARLSDVVAYYIDAVMQPHPYLSEWRVPSSFSVQRVEVEEWTRVEGEELELEQIDRIEAICERMLRNFYGVEEVADVDRLLRSKKGMRRDAGDSFS